MIRSAVTISLVPEARGGPFVFWDDLPAACEKASALGFDALEIFAPEATAVDAKLLRRLLTDHNLKVSAFGTGGGAVKHKLTLNLPEAAGRQKAREFIRSMIDLAGSFAAPVVVGSMQGRAGDVPHEEALHHLRDALEDLGEHAQQFGTPLIFEPLNRYETNLCTSLGSGVSLIESLSTKNVKLLADLFHLNIEEVDIARSIRNAKHHIGHVHLADSNRRPAGAGHIDFAPIAAALREIGYEGYLAAEALPYPDPDAAARQTIEAYRRWFTHAGHT